MRRLFFVITCVFIFTAPLRAGAEDESSEKSGGVPNIVSINISAEDVGASAENRGFSGSYTRYSAGVKWLFLSMNINRREYDWMEGPNNLGGILIQPWDSLTDLSAGLSYYRSAGEKSGLLANLSADYGFEKDSSSGAVSLKPQVFWSYNYRPRITLFAGLGASFHSVYSSTYPMLGISWKEEAGRGFYGFMGYPAVLGYRFNKSTALNLNLIFENNIYRLSEDDTVSSDVYLRTRDWKIGIGFEKSITESLILNIGINRYEERSLVFYDSGGELYSEDVEPSTSVFADISYNF
jgi:hypothetical protein